MWKQIGIDNGEIRNAVITDLQFLDVELILTVSTECCLKQRLVWNEINKRSK